MRQNFHIHHLKCYFNFFNIQLVSVWEKKQVWFLQICIKNRTNSVLIHSEYYGSHGQAIISESIDLRIDFQKFYDDKTLWIFLFQFSVGQNFTEANQTCEILVTFFMVTYLSLTLLRGEGSWKLAWR